MYSVSWYARVADLNCEIGPSLFASPNDVIACVGGVAAETAR